MMVKAIIYCFYCHFPVLPQGEMMKKKRSFILLVFFIFSLAAAAQTDIPALEKKLAGATGKERLQILNQAAASCLNLNPTKQIVFAEEALMLAKQYGDQHEEARALFLLGCAHKDLNETEKAVTYLTQAERIYTALRLPLEKFNCIKNLGWVYENTGNNDQGLAYYREGLKLARANSFAKEEAIALSYIGIIHIIKNQYDTALRYMFEALPIQEKLGDLSLIANTQNYIGSIYFELKNYPKALEYYQKSLEVYRKEDDESSMAVALNNLGTVYENTKKPRAALQVYLQALELSEKVGDKMNVGRTLGNMGGIYIDLGDLDKAMKCRQQELRIWQAIGNRDLISSTYSGISEIYLQKKDFSQARKYLEEAIRLAKELDDKPVLATSYNNLSLALEAQGDYRHALDALKKHVENKDAIYNEETTKTIAELETKYEAEKKKRQIEMLQKNVEIQKLQLSRARLRGGALVSGIGLLLIFFFFLFRRYLHLLAFWKKKTYVSHYKLERQIGSGAMGVVWQATDLTGDKKSVALKLIREEHASDPVQRKRFLNEAYLVDQLDHPNIIKVFERGEYQQNLYIAMELLSGKSLAEAIRKGVRFPLAEWLQIMRQLSDALSRIHGQGILHRDVKPANIMLTNDRSGPGTVKLLDFGLAHAPSLTHLTETGEILGTVYYMAPELISQRQVSAAGDIYALGVVLYEMLTLEKPFLGENPGEIIRAILENEPINPAHFRPDLSEEHAALVLRMLSKIPEQRPVDDDLLTAFAAAG